MAFVYNHDVSRLYRRLNRFIEELFKSVSAAGSQTINFDQVRILSYLDAITQYQTWVTSQPLLDLPETHPREYTLEDPPEAPAVENESIRDLVNLLELARDELINGQSARNSSNLTPFDDARLTAVITKANEFMSSYVQEVTPLDLPESSPMREMTGDGRKGV